MKIHCPCGAVLSDGTDEVPERSFVLSDAARARAWEQVRLDLREFFAAVADGRREAWIREVLGYPDPSSIPDWECLADRLFEVLGSASTLSFQCERCGRLALQPARGDFHWRWYLPQ